MPFSGLAHLHRGENIKKERKKEKERKREKQRKEGRKKEEGRRKEGRKEGILMG